MKSKIISLFLIAALAVGASGFSQTVEEFIEELVGFDEQVLWLGPDEIVVDSDELEFRLSGKDALFIIFRPS